MANIKTIGDAPALAEHLPALPHTKQSFALFSSPEAISRYLAGITAADKWANVAWDSAGGDSSWYGTPSMPAAIDLCQNGWKAGTEQVARLRDKINAANPTGPRLIKWDIAGAYPSVPRALAGNPMNMRRMDNAKLRRKPVITLLHQMNGLSHVKAEVFNNKAAAMAAIVDAIESAGFSVELIGVTLSDGSSGGFAHILAVTLKSAGQQVDIGSLAFSLGHAGMFRRFVFGVYCADRFNAPLGHGMGHTVEFPSLPNNAYMLPSANNCKAEFDNEQSTIAKGVPFLIKKLSEQGCPAFPQQQAA